MVAGTKEQARPLGGAYSRAVSEGQGAERRLVTILFADLVGFTSLAEGLDAEDVAAVQEQYFAQVRETIERYGGRLEKFIGDAAMAAFGVPRTRDDDPERAVRAGLALARSVEALSARVGLEEGDLRLRVGVNSGEVAYGLTDDGQWRISGDAVNVAARLQAAAQPGTVLIGEGTALAVAEAIAVEPPVELELKGKAEPIRAWRAVTLLPQRSRERAMGALRAPLLGRERELASIEAAAERARQGATETLLVVAPPGVGKTRLTEEVVKRVIEEGTGGLSVVRRARLGPETISPSAAVTQLLLSAMPEREDQLTPELTRLLSEGESEPELTASISASDLAQDRQLRFRAWIEGLDALAADRAQLWLIEDLHWSGADLLAFIEQATGLQAAAGRLILGTARPILLEQLASRPADASSLPLLELAPLSEHSSRELITALVADALPDSLAAAVAARADGNPLFIEELLRSWVSIGILVADDESRWSMSRAVDEVSLPQTVQAIYQAQLDDLPTDARALMRRASVAGRRFPRHSLDVLDLAEAEQALAVARRRAFLQEAAPDVVAGATLAYRHALLRDAGYASLARAERARLHARLAVWYEQMADRRADEVAEVIARHYAAAVAHSSRLSPRIDDGLVADGARRRAVDWYERASGWALAGAAHETARSLLREALAHAHDGETLLKARLLLRLGEATAYTADMDEGATLLSEAVQLYRRALAGPGAGADARVGYAAAAATLGRVWVQQIQFDEALRLADEALAAIGESDEPGVARLLCVRGWVRATLTADRATIADLDRALSIARASGDPGLELEVLDWRASALGEVDLVELEDWQQVERLAVELGDWSRAVKAMRMHASWKVDDEPELVWPIAERAEEIARRRGQEEDLAWLDYIRAEAGFASGEWQRAMEAGRRAVAIGESNAYHRVVVRTWHVLLPIAEARAERALIEHAFAWYESRRGTFPDSPYARIVEGAAELHFMQAGLKPYQMPAVEPRLASFASALGGPSWISAIETVIVSWLAGGELAGVRAALERMDRAIDDDSETSSLGRGAAVYLRALLREAESGEPDEIARLAREALAHFRTSGSPWWIAKALRVLLAGRQARGDEIAELRRLEQRLELALLTV
jgi:class 3 adenylate cyclase/tetratricopeptide (TPR) repeat protein